MKNKLISLFLAAIVAMNIFAADVWDGSSDIFTHGAGTESSPYLIENAEQLAFIAEMVNAGITTYPGNYFKLTTDLDLNNIAWTPIGTESSQFGGNFNGDNHTISNLKITSATNAGLFGVVSGGEYKKLTIQGTIPASVNATNAGGLIGYATEACTIDSCNNIVDIGGGNNVGGIIGYGIDISLLNCVNRVSITGKIFVGGIIGYAPNLNMVQYINCRNYGQIESSRYAGGIIGKGTRLEMRNSINKGLINISNTETIAETGTSDGTAKHIYAGASSQIYAGGIGGYLEQSQIRSCENDGDVFGTSIVKGSYNYNSGNHQAGYAGWDSWSNLKAYYYNISNISCVGGGFGSIDNTEVYYFANNGRVYSTHSTVNCPYSARSNYFWNTGASGNPSTNDWVDHIKYVNSLSFVDQDNIGGVSGKTLSTVLIYCRNFGEIYGASTGAGIVQKAESTNVLYCANVGNVVSFGISSDANVYCSYSASPNSTIGISNGTVTNSYYINGSGNGTQKSDAQMKSASMPILLNADSTVFIQDIKPNVNKGYPIFKNGMRYVTTNAATDISYTNATLNGNYYNCVPDSMGFEYKEFSEEAYLSNTIANTQGATNLLQNLTQGTTYVARYWLSEGGITYYGDTVQFTTLACPTEPVRSDTVKICDGEYYEFAGKKLTTAGTYHDSLVAQTGCDSVIELVLQKYETYKYVKYDTINSGEQYEFYGQYLTEPGIYNEYIPITNRCNWTQLYLAVRQTLSLFVNDNNMGSVDGTGNYVSGTEVVITATPNEGYHFVKWSDENTDNPRSILVMGDSSLTAIFAINKYAITFKNGNEILQSIEVEHGVVPTYNGATPTKAVDAQYTYTFAGWSPEIVAATEDATYLATFNSTVNKYTISFMNGSEVLQSTEVEYGVVPTYNGATPTKQATAQYTYTFAGWDPEVVAVTGNATYTAIFNSTVNKFTITWKDEDGSVIDQTEVAYGSVPTHADPTKQATAQYSYTFAGWTPEIVAVTGDATYSATYNSSVNKYTITFKNGNEVLQSTDVEYGVVPSYNGATPTKQADAQYTYTFAGWDAEVVAVTGNATYTALFNSTINKYPITWKQDDGTTIDQTMVEYGQMPTHADPAKPATAQYTYTFAGWTPEVVAVTGAATYVATYTSTVNKYSIIWKDEDGSVIDQTEVAYGSVPTHTDPTKPATVQYTYTFAGWTPEVVAVTSNATYIATYTSTLRKYTITFLNDDGLVLSANQWNYGAIPTCDEPTKPATAQYTYTFAGWTPEVVKVTGNATYTATYTSTLRKYTITFLDEDGTTLSSQQWNYGATPTCDEPTKASTAQYTYTFAGWTPEVVKVTGNASYTATYTSTLRKYTITFLDEDGTTLSSQQWNYGATPTCDEPTKAATAQYSYTFAGWTPEVTKVTGNATYTATYTSTLRKYTVTFLDEDGTTLSSQQWNYGTTPTCDEPSKPATAQYTYTFAGWTPEVKLVTGNATYTATYTSTLRKYTITFLDEDGTILSSQQWNYGATPTCDEPSKPATAQYTYTFAGWTPEVKQVTGNATYTATYTSLLNKYTVTWKNDDGSIIDQTEVAYGSVPTHADPTKQATAQYIYTFAGWTPEVVAVTGNASYTATYTSTVKKYTITFMDEDGTVLCEDEWEYGSMPSCNDPTKAADYDYTYTFAGWTPDVVAVTGIATYVATYTAEPINHEDIPATYVEPQAVKVIRDDKIYILRGDKTYTITGQEVRY